MSGSTEVVDDSSAVTDSVESDSVDVVVEEGSEQSAAVEQSLDSTMESTDVDENDPASTNPETKGVRFSAWLALIGAVATVVVSSAVTYYVSRESISAATRDTTLQREAEQRDLRRAAYKDFLILAMEALRYERQFWCTYKWPTDNYAGVIGKCTDAPDGSELAVKLRASLAAVSLDGSSNVQRVAVKVVDAMDLMDDYESLMRASQDIYGLAIPDNAERAIRFEYSNLLDAMCEDLASDPEDCDGSRNPGGSWYWQMGVARPAD